eukprot:1151695-Pelagomonas_calceolata.AAC.4
MSSSRPWLRHTPKDQASKADPYPQLICSHSKLSSLQGQDHVPESANTRTWAGTCVCEDLGLRHLHEAQGAGKSRCTQAHGSGHARACYQCSRAAADMCR